MEMLKNMQNLPENDEFNNDEILTWLQKYEIEKDSKTKKHYETLVLMAYMPLVNKIAKGLARRKINGFSYQTSSNVFLVALKISSHTIDCVDHNKLWKIHFF